MYIMIDVTSAQFGLLNTLKRKVKVGLGRASHKVVEGLHTSASAVMNIGSKKRGERLLKSIDADKIMPRDLPAGVDPNKPINMLVHGIGGGDRKGKHLLREQASWFGDSEKQFGNNSIAHSPRSLRVKDVNKTSPLDFLRTGWNGTRKGGDDDAKEIAENIIGWKKKHPGLKVNTVGHSLGGSISERAGAVLDKYGYGDNVKTTTLGSPASALKRDKNFKALAFDRDKTVSEGLSKTKKRKKEGVNVEVVKNKGSHSTYDVMQNPSILKKVKENMYV